MPSLDEKDARSMEFYMQLCSFKEGVLFAGRYHHPHRLSARHTVAGRYKIESERIQGKPQCRYAINERTGQRVFLKFFRRESAEFANAVKIHRALEPENKFVSRCVQRHRWPAAPHVFYAQIAGEHRKHPWLSAVSGL